MDIRKLLEHQKGIYEETTRNEVEEGLGHAIFQRTRRTFIDTDGSPVTIETGKLHRLDCGHLVGSVGSQEILGICQQCGNSICIRCAAQSRCVRCLKLLCPSCVKLWNGEPYCTSCRSMAWLKRGLRKLHAELSE